MMIFCCLYSCQAYKHSSHCLAIRSKVTFVRVLEHAFIDGRLVSQEIDESKAEAYRTALQVEMDRSRAKAEVAAQAAAVAAEKKKYLEETCLCPITQVLKVCRYRYTDIIVFFQSILSIFVSMLLCFSVHPMISIQRKVALSVSFTY